MNYHYRDTERLSDPELEVLAAPFAVKLAWFAKHGYVPHYWQLLFHCAGTRYRHLVAGRRGGKTLSAAWEMAFYCLNPAYFALDFPDANPKPRSLHFWVLTSDHTQGNVALRNFREVLDQIGLTPHDYTENKGDRFFIFESEWGKVLIEFKSADNPQKLRGAGLDWLWMDEAAFIPNRDAWDVVRPALSDKIGRVVSTTTPDGKNWFHEVFWAPELMDATNHTRVEYTSLHNIYFSEEEWQEAQRDMHPMIFRKEYMAAFDAMAGKELQGDWLKWYTMAELEALGFYDPRTESYKGMKLYLGVDPAISLSDHNDRFAMTLVGVSPSMRVYMLDQYADRIPFGDQLDKIAEWHVKYSPELVAVEAVAYQAALVQQLERMPGFVPVVPMFAKGKKSERILAMAPLFKLGRVKLRKDHHDFMNEWIDYDSTIRNPKDDTLDATEIALRAAGALLPPLPEIKRDPLDFPAVDLDDLARRRRPGSRFSEQHKSVDYALGGDW